MGDQEQITLKLVPEIGAIPAAEWDACAGTGNPFVSHAFLKALEDAGCVTARSGWAPQHLVLDDGAGGLLGAAPMYLKGHSQGEYVFDHSWAAAYERAGGQYYPKLLVAVPFTPATGPRLLVRPGPQADMVRDHLLKGLAEATRQLGVSSCSINYATEEEWRRAGELGFLQRTSQQFHWINEGYTSFDDFLGELASRKRKGLKKERREAAQNGITLEHVTGDDLTSDHWDAFYRFYMDTASRKWGRPYLNREFFERIQETLRESTLLVMAKRDGRYIAGALNFIGEDTLFGRNWGCIEDHKFLHFETCYYQAIDFAIAHGLSKVEAGAQGQHKLARGYLPTHTYSAHWIADPGFRRAVANFLEEERGYIDEGIEILGERVPFRKSEA